MKNKLIAAAFTLETIAHLQGRERDLLPLAEAVRAAERVLSHVARGEAKSPTDLADELLRDVSYAAPEGGAA